ncbi:hypothetical protein [Rathayibacter iranicus]|uniref:Uncharacterized protein n=2 Tax=Rathayibacter iranicus TaxID=59737 RepID=A0AAD1ABQ7_9MICO|nr:hypothetical protein [Rathayibacter iranicus]AZZ55356.1 hypothetical protein C7V51_05235 [Rathayibacter iranicus]MWV30915.1 hypothetical protein [Rathayibacter iranicus NCPPB 2253 = VKM Ac-1602]PPI61360.1 hypothetical protein C5E08_05215 [Rathayibacter iranicus]PWJ65955.1 hypothetical protein B0H03_10295 [Rathayibacter iranicus NCPPB 2253 = VKM Ac-1602]
MRTRRAFGSWQFPAAIVLPLWILVGYGLFGGSSGWTVLGLVIALPILSVALAVVASIVAFRVTVRPTRIPAWGDVAAVGAWHLSLVALGFFPPGAWALGVLSVALGVAAFWHSTWRFVSDARATLLAFAAASTEHSEAATLRVDGFDPERPQDGQTIVL